MDTNFSWHVPCTDAADYCSGSRAGCQVTGTRVISLLWERQPARSAPAPCVELKARSWSGRGTRSWCGSGSWRRCGGNSWRRSSRRCGSGCRYRCRCWSGGGCRRPVQFRARQIVQFRARENAADWAESPCSEHHPIGQQVRRVLFAPDVKIARVELCFSLVEGIERFFAANRLVCLTRETCCRRCNFCYSWQQLDFPCPSFPSLVSS